MEIITVQPAKTINKAYRKLNIVRRDKDAFKFHLKNFLKSINPNESEEHNMNNIKKFLENSFYKNIFYINTKGRIDLAIHKDNKPASPAIVLLEAKSPSNNNEMITKTELNRKSFLELVLYYLRERNESKNFEIKKLIITNAYEWYVFDAADFERLFYNNGKFNKIFEKWRDDACVDSRTQTFYDFTSQEINNSTDSLQCARFDLRDYREVLDNYSEEDDKLLIPLYKLFTPEHLLNKPFANDSNSLNQDFYYELLYILGLEECNVGGKKVIIRCSEKTRADGSVIENIIRKIESENRLSVINDIYSFGKNRAEQTFGVAIELALTWLNRILFMKLLESQLIRYNKGNEQYKFLDPEKNQKYDNLNTLFFQVLNIKEDFRNKNVKEKFASIPYLNSSLFETTELEMKMFTISGLENDYKLEFFPRTVLKHRDGRRKKGEMLTQVYLLKFLDAYNFGSTTADEIIEEDKTLINASVLGLVFEKINGYKDGSYFTPGFITMYMASELVRLAVIQKFNERYGWQLESFKDLYNTIDKISIEEANSVIDDLKICDPAAGSGHFLVSALNEIIALKSKLGILVDEDGMRIKNYSITVENDELHIENTEGELFEYYAIEGDSEKGRKINSEKQRFQETIFNEKRKIIENCLFGVDINPNSVQICRLRLWIELLKCAYYTKDSSFRSMETLPNIDINIKTGNSLVMKYSFSDIFPEKDRPALFEYRNAINAYKSTTDRDVKAALKKTIENIRKKFKGFWQPENKELSKLAVELHKLNTEAGFLGSAKDEERLRAKREKLSRKIEELQKKNDENSNDELYRNAFEWRFEFPEVLDDNGNYKGFDIVIGNPPYGVNLSEELKNYYRVNYEAARTRRNGNGNGESGYTIKGSLDTFALFIERGLTLLHKDTMLSMIVPLAITSSESMIALHNKIFEECRIFKVSTYSNRPKKIFDNADQRVAVIFANKTNTKIEKLFTSKVNKRYADESIEKIIANLSFVNSIDYIKYGRIPKIGSKIELSILKKLFSIKTTLKDMKVGKKGNPVYYRAAGGRYYNIITNFSTNSSAEKFIRVLKKYRDLTAAILSSNLYYWFYHIYSDTINMKSYELETFPIPLEKIENQKIKEIEKLYKEYLNDLHKNSKIKKVNYAHITEYREYYARYSKPIIDKIDLAIKEAYGLTDEEINFIMNYDLKYRTDDNE